MTPFGCWVSGWCAALALHHAIEGNAWWTLIMATLAAVNLWLAYTSRRGRAA